MTCPPRVGVLGGTFDPVHLGHLAAARSAQRALALTSVLFVPSHHPPHRPASPFASGAERLAMLDIAIAATPGWRTSTIELERDGPSYTYDTLAALHEKGLEPTQLFFIIGIDAFADIATWSRYPAVLDAAHFVVIARHRAARGAGAPGHADALSSALPPGLRSTLAGRMTTPEALSEPSTAATTTAVVLLDVETPDVSSTAIRQRARAGQDISDLVPAGVDAYVTRHGLYREPVEARPIAPPPGR
jgi:nicotinate-nucleotide adenylyltransferase